MKWEENLRISEQYVTHMLVCDLTEFIQQPFEVLQRR